MLSAAPAAQTSLGRAPPRGATRGRRLPTREKAPAGPARSLLGRCAFEAREGRVALAVSGGPDSLALLALACETGADVTAYHVDHGLRSGSASEAGVVESAARALGAGFEARRVIVEPGPNLEARARAARWAVLPPGAATGHTADDQAETVLLNLLRGAALDGLAGMRLGPRHPILRLRRSETEELCRALHLEPVRDPSNNDPSFLRNRVRHELLPALGTLSGRDLVPVIVRQAALMAADADLLDQFAASIDVRDAAALAGAPAPLARRTVRRWLRGSSEHPPPSADVDRVLAVARGEARATQVSGGTVVRRLRGRLVAEPPGGSEG
ncbi:MAG: tRNA lysidine(34) synthetase TilS [Acidimicrobiales bacterium]